jgi:hypothetical protein
MDTINTSHTAVNKSGFIKWAMVIAIVIVLNLLFNYAISLIYKAPSYDAFMPQTQVVEPITNKADCLKVGGQWTDPDTRYQTPAPAVITGVKTTPAMGYCDPNYTKQMEYTKALKNYDRTVFIILVVLGIISLVLGVIFGNAILSLAFSWGGVLSLIIASMRYWSDADNLLKVIILAAALGALIFVAVRKFGK